jgi:two-component system, cell cycle sensor histidine kinase and response regulator CckA
LTTTVLVVEDEALIAGDIKETLVRLGYQVPVTVSTGQRALLAAADLKPNLILMDIKLRGEMDGVEAAAEIRTQADVPIVYLTSHSDEETLSRAKATSPHGYLLKPFTERELRTAIEVALHRHQLEMRLADRERWFSTTLRSIGDAVVTTDPFESITFLNDVAHTLTGWGAEAVGRPFTEVFNVIDAGGKPIPSMAGLALTASTSVELPDHSRLQSKTGQHIAIDDVASPIVDDKGSLLGSVVVFRDVTRRRALEEQATRSARLASLGTLVAGVAHEINNPLSYVLSNTQVSLDLVDQMLGRLKPATETDFEGAREDLNEVRLALVDSQAGAERVRLIVSGLMGFVRGSRGPGTPVDLEQALAVAIKMTEHAVRPNARVRREPGQLPRVLGQEHAFSQVFSNLLLNAAQAIGEGRPEENEIVVSTTTNEQGWAVVEVRDTGPGIPAEALLRLFDPFFTTKPPGSGTGLGLSISHSIIADAGGSLIAANHPGGGALFRVMLPPTS